VDRQSLQTLDRPFSSRVSGIVAISILTLALSLFHTGQIPLTNRDEGRYAEVAREMFASRDWLVPRLFGVPYLEKPPLFYWLTAAAYRVIGVDEFGARLLPSVAATAGVLLTGLFAERMFGKTAGLASAAILGTSGLYFVFARVAVTDMLFSVLLAGALLAYFLAETEERTFVPFWLLAAAATLTKGPVAAVLCGFVAVGHIAVRGSWRSLFAARFWVGLPLYLALVLPWFVLIELRYHTFLQFYFYKEHVLRVAGDEHRHSFLWYFPWLLVGFLPWTPLFFTALPAIGRRTQEDSRAGGAARFAVIWVAIVLVFFSVPRGKLIPYILPVFPSLAMLLGDAVARAIDVESMGRAMRLAFTTTGTTLVLAAIGLPFAMRCSPVTIPAGLGVLAVAVTLVAGAVTVHSARRQDWRPIAAVAGSIAALQCVAAVAAAPISQYVSVRPVIEILRGQLRPGDQVALYTGYFPSAPFYLQRIPYFVFGNRELDFGISLDGRGSWIVDDLNELDKRIGRRRSFILLRTNFNDLRDLRDKYGEIRMLYSGSLSWLLEIVPRHDD
jgi:4-amino-4-deoxy-L-arabinose transferase-like glycosyltransferase